jgi:hypothetical protein
MEIDWDKRLADRVGMKTYRPYEPNQPLVLPASLADYLPEDDLAYFVPEVVAALDLAAILAPYEREARGCPPYHPQMLVGLLLCAYARGVYSSRRIAAACRYDVGFMVVTARQTPDFRPQSEGRAGTAGPGAGGGRRALPRAGRGAAEDAVQRHRPRVVHHEDAGGLRPVLQRAGGGGCRLPRHCGA